MTRIFALTQVQRLVKTTTGGSVNADLANVLLDESQNYVTERLPDILAGGLMVGVSIVEPISSGADLPCFSKPDGFVKLKVLKKQVSATGIVPVEEIDYNELIDIYAKSQFGNLSTCSSNLCAHRGSYIYYYPKLIAQTNFFVEYRREPTEWVDDTQESDITYKPALWWVIYWTCARLFLLDSKPDKASAMIQLINAGIKETNSLYKIHIPDFLIPQ